MNHTTLRHALDAISVSTAVGAVAGVLPPLSAALSIIWLTIQIAEWFHKKMGE